MPVYRLTIMPRLLAILSLAAAFCAQPSPAYAHMFNSLEQAFASPPIEYSTAPFWVWNDVVTKEKIDRDLQLFKEQNIHQVILHQRPGLITEYLGHDWHRLVEYSIDRAHALNMNVWLYDENSFPSGFGGGHVAAAMPESVEHGDSLVLQRIDPAVRPDPSQFECLVSVGYAASVLKNSLPGQPPQADVSDQTLYGFRAVRDKPNGWYGGSTYVDLLIPGVTETFIEVTMRGYEEKLGGEFGARVPGIFTDEPNIAPTGSRQGIRWTPSLFADFEARWGYDLRPHLPSLYEGIGDWKTARHNYHALLLDLFIDRWSKPWFAYTEEKNLQWTGHYWEHGWPSPYHGGDNMAMYAWHQVPGIDMLFNTFENRPDQFGNNRAVKELSSVANQLGRHRALSETYGGAGWDLDFADMKRYGDWQAVLGVNLMNQHLSYMTLKGRRKGDFPQSFSYHAPYWEDYGVLASYFHRLSYALTRGEQVNEILVLEPTTTAWMYYSPIEHHAMLDVIEYSFRELVDLLERAQVEYDLASEDIMEDHGRVARDRLVVGERSYSLVVIPEHMENLDRPTFELLQAYVKGGGECVLVGDPPTRVDGRIEPELRALFATEQAQVSRIGRNRNLVSQLSTSRLYGADFIPVEPESYGGQLHHMRRLLDDGQILFWANFSEDDYAQGRFECRGKDVSLLDPFTGSISAYPSERIGEHVRVEFQIPPAGSLLLFVSAKNRRDGPVESFPSRNWRVVSASTTTIRNDPNSLAIDYLDFEAGELEMSGTYFSPASDAAFRENGIERYGRWGFDPWAVAVQYKTNILDMAERFGPDSGYTAAYHFEVTPGFASRDLRAVIEWAHLYDIEVNGVAVQPLPGEWWLDQSFGVIDLVPHLKPGRNTIRLSVSPMNIHAEVEPVFVIGDFSLQSSDRGFVLHPPTPLEIGPWNDQGLPMYSGSVAYTKVIPGRAGARYRVKLNDWNGTVARVLVNGQEVGHIFTEPYQLDINKWIHAGDNEFTVEVVGSLQNILGPHHNDPTPGLVTPWSWFFAPAEQPAGKDYELRAYGLFKDFEVLEAPAANAALR